MNSGGYNFYATNITCDRLNVRNQGASNGSSASNVMAIDFATIPTFTIPNGYYRYSFVCYNSGSSTNKFVVDYLTSYADVAKNYSIRVYTQNLWSTDPVQATINTYLVSKTAAANNGFNIQLNWQTIGTNTQLSPVGNTEPLMVVVELVPYP